MSDNRTRLKTLFTTSEPPGLGPGSRTCAQPLTELERELKSLLGSSELSQTSGDLIRALVLLWHDHLDASHTISQGIETPDGSLLHAIMHRREPDYWNSKYWWRRVGKHPCFGELGRRVVEFLKARGEVQLCAQLAPHGQWEPAAFVDACETAASGAKTSERIRILREVQRIETEVALEFFLQRGAG